MSESGESDAQRVRELKRELRDKAILLADLEVIIEDYRRERGRLLEELMSLREKLWDLEGQQGSEAATDRVED
jgi:hypothetical protein